MLALKGWLDEPDVACPPEDAFAWGNKLLNWDRTDDWPWFEFEDKAAAKAAREFAVALTVDADDADVEDDDDDGAELFVLFEGVGDDCVVDGVDDGDVLKLPIVCWCCWRMFDGVGEDIADEVDEDVAPVVDLIETFFILNYSYKIDRKFSNIYLLKSVNLS